MPTLPTTLAEAFNETSKVIETLSINAAHYANTFLADTPRDQVAGLHRYLDPIIDQLASARDYPGMQDFAREQWNKPSLDWVAYIGNIMTQSNDVMVFIQQNFPTVRTTLNAAMNAVGMPAGQQDALRAQMGTNLEYLLVFQIQSGSIVPPNIAASALAPCVTALNEVVAACTVP